MKTLSNAGHLTVVQEVPKAVLARTGRTWLPRVLLPLLAVMMFMALNHRFNLWTGLTDYRAFRRGVATFALGTLLFGPAVLLRARSQAAYLTVASGITSSLFLANILYSSYAGGFMSASTLSYLWQAGYVGGSAQQLWQGSMVLLLVPPAFFFIFLFLPSRFVKSRLPQALNEWSQWPTLKWQAVLAVVAGIVALSSAGYGYTAIRELQDHGNLSSITTKPFDSRELVQKLGISNYNLIDTVNYLRRKETLTPEEVAFVVKHRQQHLSLPGVNAMTGKLKGRNVILFQLESFQQFLIEKTINGQEITPNLNKLAGQSFQFTNFNYVVGPGTSSDGEFVAFNSLMPLANQSVVFDYPASDYRAYPAAMRGQGYTTHVYHAHSRNFWNRANTYPKFGFDEYLSESSYQADGRKLVGFGLGDREFVQQTAELMKRMRAPFYAHITTLTSHSPFHLPKEFQTLDLSGIELSPLVRDYLQSVHYTDKAIGDLMTALERNQQLANTAVIAMGDHEGFIFRPEDEEFAEFLGFDGGFDDRNIRAARTVPFFIYAPGTNWVGTDDRPASQIDIYPTLMNLLGLKPPEAALGVDLFGAQVPTVVQRSRGLGASIDNAQRGGWLYVERSVQGGQPACYRDAERVAIKDCQELKEFAVTRSLLSDYVITGNRLDLLTEH